MSKARQPVYPSMLYDGYTIKNRDAFPTDATLVSCWRASWNDEAPTRVVICTRKRQSKGTRVCIVLTARRGTRTTKHLVRASDAFFLDYKDARRYKLNRLRRELANALDDVASVREKLARARAIPTRAPKP